MPKSQINPELDLYQDHEPESLLAEDDTWLITEFTQGNVPGHSYLAFEGINYKGEQWLWACDFVTFDHLIHNQQGRFEVISPAIAGLPGVVRTTSPSPSNKGGAERATISQNEIFSDAAKAMRRLGPSHRVKIADAKRGQAQVNKDEVDPPEYGLLGAAFFTSAVHRYNCAGWVRSIILSCGVPLHVADQGILISGSESFPKSRDLRCRFSSTT